ncbi:hypothetical protein [Rhizobium sp. FKL33]|uniref:hypothetical protein n=1 Tax=Rhizobium sp. FKL33 TaxID=2562307 RepID=UPI0010C07675|nr:hypothetical protein [Rhizobium sp. FKL33]
MFLRLAVAGLFACSAAYSMHLAIENGRAREMVAAARELEKSRTSYSASQLDQLVLSDGMALAMETCRSDVLRPALSVQLVSASMRDVGADFDGWSRSMGQAQSLVRHMARCMPSEGNVWVRDSLLSRAIAENPTELADKIAINVALSPNEAIQLQARLALWKKLTPTTLEAAQDVMTADVSTILNYGDQRLLKPLLENTPVSLSAVVDSEISRLADDRKNYIQVIRGRLNKSSRLH